MATVDGVVVVAAMLVVGIAEVILNKKREKLSSSLEAKKQSARIN